MEQTVNKNIPVIFQNLEQFEKEDERFLKVKIWLMHTGVNLNGSSFSKQAVEAALPTLANTPILSFIEENSSGEQDFSDHRMVLHRSEDGELGIKYLGQAVGVIPSDNNAHWEKRVTDSGEEKEYLVVEGLMWTKWDDPINIMNRKITTAQSMELSDTYSGYFDNNGIFHFETFKFFGACLLGSDVSPAMVNSTVEVQFSNNQDIQNSIESKLQEFYTLFSSKGGNTEMEQETQVETETVEQTEFTEETPETVNEEVETTEDNGDVVEETFEEVKTETNTEVEQVEETQTEFTLTSEQLKHQLRSALSNEKYIDRWGDSCRRYWYVDYTTEVVIYEDSQNNDQLFSAVYALNGDEVTVDFAGAKKVKIEYVPFETAELFTITTEKFEAVKSSLTSELEELKSFKRSREEQDLADKFTNKLTEDEIKAVFEASKDLSLNVVEEKLMAKFGQKNFSLVEDKSSTNVIALNINKENKPDSPYGDFFK